MLVSLIKKNKIYTLSLPSNVYGNYWIQDKDEKGKERDLINIEETDGAWKITSNFECQLVDGNKNIISETILKEFSFYYVQINHESSLSILYCSPIYDESYIHLDLRNTHTVSIGSDPANNIIYDVPTIAKQHTRLNFNSGQWEIEDLQSPFGTYVNGKRVLKAPLSYGDIIFIMGLKIIVLNGELIVNNPFNRVRFDSTIFIMHKKNVPEFMGESEEDESAIELYEENDYFFRSPRFKTVIEKEQMVIDPPPTKQNQEEQPLLMMLGPMMTMGMTSMMTLYTSVERVMSGEADLSSATPSLVMGGAMLASMILWPLVNRSYQKKKKREYEQERQVKYGKYIEDKKNEIDIIMKKQRQILIENNITIPECETIILNRTRQLWERKIEQDDFLEVRLGIGNKPVELDIRYPEEHFTMDEDNLRDILNTVVNKSKDLVGVPLSVSLTEKYITGIVGKRQDTIPFMKELLLQIITFHSYEDLKLVFFVGEENREDWEWVKVLPHVWNDDKTIRFFSTEYEEMRNISSYLEKILQQRIPNNEGSGSKDYKSFTPYYIIITDNYRMTQGIEILIDALKQKTNIGFNVMVINEELSTLPNECTTFISVLNKNGGLFESELTSTKQKEFVIDNIAPNNLKACCTKLANIPIKMKKQLYALPSVYTFLEMYNVGKVEQLNALFRWKMSDTTKSLQVPVGLDEHGMLFRLDIHEKAHGPHGLIAGMTGSGKSEFIITYILSLAVNYHPQDVSFILIDYKGGGLAGAFKNEETGVKLPHLAGTITNLDTTEMKRTLVSIQSELRRRQRIFNEARAALNEGTIDIYKYQRLYHDGSVKEPISHLLIISDEFAELKANQPDFMDQLISTARIGRSLGVHLILATQKPSGVVNDQIWSNSRFRICLKVQDKADSQDMIKCPDAAEIQQTGRFFLQVGYNEYFALGQSAWCGAPYVPTDKVRKKIDNSLNFINDTGTIIKDVEPQKKVATVSMGEQLPNIVKYLSDVAKKENIQIHQLWLDKIPAYIVVDRLKEKYNYEPKKGVINPIIGEYDDPFNQYQGLLTLPLSTEGNTIIYGSASSGKELVINSLLYSTMEDHTPEEVNFYILEFGSESLRIFQKAPHVGDILFVNDEEKIANLFKMLQKEIATRKDLFADYNGDYDFYINNSGKMIPSIIVIINNYEAFNETYNQYEDTISQLTREGVKYGIIFVLTTSASNMVRYRLSQNFKEKLALQLNDENDYSSILGNVKKMKPAAIEGRGLVRLADVYEFQTAHICKDEEASKLIREFCMKLDSSTRIKAKKVPTLPEKVTIDFVKDAFTGLQNVPIGVNKETLEIETFNFQTGFSTLITSQDSSLFASFVTPLINEFSRLGNTKIHILLAEEYAIKQKLKIPYVDNQLDNAMTEINTEVKRIHEIYAKSNYDIRSIAQEPYHLCIILGIDLFFSKISAENKKEFEKMITTAKETGKYSFILVDTVDKFKKMEYDQWYRNVISNNQGIWLGNGVADQYTIKISKMSKALYAEVENNFGYKVTKGTPSLIKVLQEEGESNE